MTSEEIADVERAAGVSLPASYKQVLLDFPIPAYRGNAEIGVWDNPDRLIEENRYLHRGGGAQGKPWPNHFFAIGHPGDGSPYALDLRDGAVWWVDHGHLDSENSQKEADSFESWARNYFAGLREEMIGDDVDPDGTPEQRLAVAAVSARQTTIGCLAMLVVAATIMAAAWWVWLMITAPD